MQIHAMKDCGRTAGQRDEQGAFVQKRCSQDAFVGSFVGSFFVLFLFHITGAGLARAAASLHHRHFGRAASLV
jgi:hypothetical protein